MRSAYTAGWRIALTLGLLFLLLRGTAYAQSGTYTVRSGDTLNSIAAANGTTVVAIMKANGLGSSEIIRAGQTLKLPSGSTSSATASTAGTRYTVKRGDTLAKIAVRFGVSTAALMRANDISRPELLYAGATLVIPAASGSASTGGSGSAKSAPVGPPSPGNSYNQPGGGPQNYLAPTRFAVSVSQQHCWLIEDNQVTGSWPCSTGRKGYATPAGFYTIESKMPVAYGSQWNFYMPYWLGIYYLGTVENGIHGLPYNSWGYHDWKDKIGTPISFGCIVLDDPAAKALYSVAFVGMQVIILS